MKEGGPRKSPASSTPTAGHSPPDATEPLSTPANSQAANNGLGPTLSGPSEAMVGSPLKKSRPSLPGMEDDTLHKRLGLGVAGGIGDVLGRIEHAEKGKKQGQAAEVDEEL